MPQKLLVYQSLWAMERRRPDGQEWSLTEKLEMIRDAGFDGAGVRFIDADYAREVTGFLRAHGMSWQAQCYPRRRRGPEAGAGAGAGTRRRPRQPATRRAAVSADRMRPVHRGLAPAGGGSRASPLHIETHRDRMTTDLFFTLHLLDCFPDLRLTADLSHYVVGREFAWPIAPENHAMIHRMLDNSWGLHGRVASREQIQVQLGFPQHRDWVELFMGWWEYGIRSWRRRADPRRDTYIPLRARPTHLCDHRRGRLRTVRPLAGSAADAGHDPRAVAADRAGGCLAVAARNDERPDAQ